MRFDSSPILLTGGCGAKFIQFVQLHGLTPFKIAAAIDEIHPLYEVGRNMARMILVDEETVTNEKEKENKTQNPKARLLIHIPILLLVPNLSLPIYNSQFPISFPSFLLSSFLSFFISFPLPFEKIKRTN